MMKHAISTVGILFALLPTVAQAAPTYDQLHPYYAEFCAVTQLTPVEGGGGGIGGHGVLYLKGACRETSRGYPRLKVCAPGSKNLSDPESGVSISVDKTFKTVNWVAADGKDFLIRGGVRADQPVDKAAEDRVVQKVLAQGLFDGISVHDEYLKDKPADMPMPEFLARQAISTDYAMNFGRNVVCARLPIKANMLPAMIDYLNGRNDEYRGDQVYNWSGIYNNCTHTTRNALAAAGIMSALATDKILPVQAFNLAIPSNQFVTLMRVGNETSLKDVVGFYRDPYKRKMLVDNDWMVVQPGVLSEMVGAHEFENSRNKVDKSGFFLADIPVLNVKRKQLKHILNDARYTEVRENLLTFQAKYREALKKRISLDRLRDDQNLNRDSALDSPEFEAFYSKYYAHIQNALNDVTNQLAQFP